MLQEKGQRGATPSQPDFETTANNPAFTPSARAVQRLRARFAISIPVARAIVELAGLTPDGRAA